MVAKDMDFRRRLSGAFASEWSRVIFLFLGAMSLAATILLLFATIAAAYTGDWGLPVLVAAVMLFFVLRTLLILGLVFGPALIAAIMVWTGYKILFKKRSKKDLNEVSSDGEQHKRN